MNLDCVVLIFVLMGLNDGIVGLLLEVCVDLFFELLDLFCVFVGELKEFVFFCVEFVELVGLLNEVVLLFLEVFVEDFVWLLKEEVLLFLDEFVLDLFGFLNEEVLLVFVEFLDEDFDLDGFLNVDVLFLVLEIFWVIVLVDFDCCVVLLLFGMVLFFMDCCCVFMFILLVNVGVLFFVFCFEFVVLGLYFFVMFIVLLLGL